MEILEKKNFRVVIFVLAVLAIGLNIWLFMPRRDIANDVVESGRPPLVIPPEGFAPNDTGGKIPGNPDKTVQDMKRLYQYMRVFKKRHGRFPNNNVMPDLDTDMKSHLAAYGLDPRADVNILFRNTDIKYSDLYKNLPNAENADPMLQPGQRPDGTPVGSAKVAGTRDVLAFCNLYFHRNERVFSNRRNVSNPVGFYIVLWEDGQVEKISWDKVRFARPQRGPFDECFPGQAGVPQEAYEYEEAKTHTLPLKADGSNPNVGKANEAQKP